MLYQCKQQIDQLCNNGTDESNEFDVTVYHTGMSKYMTFVVEH